MKRYVFALLVAGAMVFATNSTAEAGGGWGTSNSGYGSNGSSLVGYRTVGLRRANFGYGSNGSSFGVRAFSGGSTGSVYGVRTVGLRRANFGGGSNGSYRAGLGTRMGSLWANRRFRPIQRMRNARAQRIATLAQHGQELNMMQDMTMGSEQFMLIPEAAGVIQIQEAPPVQIIVPETSSILYEVPSPVAVVAPQQPTSFSLIEATPVPNVVVHERVAVVSQPVFQLVTPVVAYVAEPTTLGQKLRDRRVRRATSGNPQAFMLVTSY